MDEDTFKEIIHWGFLAYQFFPHDRFFPFFFFLFNLYILYNNILLLLSEYTGQGIT